MVGEPVITGAKRNRPNKAWRPRIGVATAEGAHRPTRTSVFITSSFQEAVTGAEPEEAVRPVRAAVGALNPARHPGLSPGSVPSVREMRL